MAHVSEMNIQFTGSSSDGHSCSQLSNCTLPQNLYDKTAHFRVTSPMNTCATILLFSQILDMPHLANRWIMLTEKYSLTLACVHRKVSNLLLQLVKNGSKSESVALTVANIMTASAWSLLHV